LGVGGVGLRAFVGWHEESPNACAVACGCGPIAHSEEGRLAKRVVSSCTANPNPLSIHKPPPPEPTPTQNQNQMHKAIATLEAKSAATVKQQDLRTAAYDVICLAALRCVARGRLLAARGM